MKYYHREDRNSMHLLSSQYQTSFFLNQESEISHVSSQNVEEDITRNSAYSDVTNESYYVNPIRASGTTKKFRESQSISTDAEMTTLQNDRDSKLLHPDETPTDPLQDDLQIDTDTSLEKIHHIETSLWRGNFRWVSLDTLLQRIGYFLILRSDDVKFKDDEKRCCSQPVWLSGGSFPVESDSARQRVLFVDGLCQGAQFVIFRTLHTGLTALTLYQLYNYLDQKPSLQCHNPTAEKSVESLWEFWRNSDDRVLLGVFHDALGAQNTDLSYLKYILVTPLVWGIGKGLWNTRESSLSNEDISKNLEEMDSLNPSIGRDFLRWLLPLHPINRKMGTLMKNVLWNPNVSSQDLQTIWKRLQILVTDHQGYTPLNALFHVVTLVHSLNTKDVEMFTPTLLKKENIDEKTELLSSSNLGQMIFQEEDVLENMLNGTLYDRTLIKRQAFKFIQDISHFKRISEEKTLRKKIQRGIIVIYANYLLWSLGAPKSLIEIIVPTLFKGGKLYVQIKLIQTLVNAFLEAQKCPKQPGVSITGVEPWANDLTQACFEANVQAFNIIPGQPVDTLVGSLDKYYFPGCTIDLDLSGRGLSGEAVTNITRALLYHNITIKSINLSGNSINRPQDFESLFPLIADIENLDLSHNGIDIVSGGVRSLGKELSNLTQLLSLNLSWNSILREDSVKEIGEGLSHLTKLTSLGLSRVFNNYKGTESMIAVGQGISCLKHLTFLDLSFNDIGSSGEEGMNSIGLGISRLNQLTHLDFSGNFFANKMSKNGSVAIGKGIGNLNKLMFLNISFNDMGTTWSLDGVQAFGHGLAIMRYLTLLDISQNAIGNDAKFVEAIGSNLSNLRKLTFLDLSGNFIGNVSSNGLLDITGALSNMTELSSLDLSWNFIANYDEAFTKLVSLIHRLSSLHSFRMVDPYLSVSKVTIINEALLYTRAPPILSTIGTPEDADNFCQTLPSNAKNCNLSRRMFNPDTLTIKALIQCLQNKSSLVHIDLSGNAIGISDSASTQELGDGLKFLIHLTSLDLSDNYIDLKDSIGTVAIGNGISHLIHLISLDMSSNVIGKIDSFGEIALAQGLAYLSQLSFLDLSNNNIGFQSSKGTVALGNAFTNLTKIAFLDLSSNFLDKGMISIGKGVMRLVNLTSLDVSNNNIGYQYQEDATVFGLGLASLKSLIYLDLSGNFLGYLGSEAMIAIGRSIANLTLLTSLDLSGNRIDFRDSNGSIALAWGLNFTHNLKYLNLGCTNSCTGLLCRFICNDIGYTNPEGPATLLPVLLTLPHLDLAVLNLQNAENVSWTQASGFLQNRRFQAMAEACQSSKCYGGDIQTINGDQSVETFHEPTELNFLTLVDTWNTPATSSASRPFTLFSSFFKVMKDLSESPSVNYMMIGFGAEILFKAGIPLLLAYAAVE